MSITIPRMIDAPRWRAAHQPLNRLSQNPPGSHLVGIVALAPGSYLVGQDLVLTPSLSFGTIQSYLDKYLRLFASLC
ncbi:MAG: hypothetical protein KGJ16_04520, partial [Betaproteobacteria bacterium]|nr:hypothetical protein [Betaproteobacteria bacterium]MDE2187562.1 hypothetical protein [Betaproteobacteria bacterium]